MNIISYFSVSYLKFSPSWNIVLVCDKNVQGGSCCSLTASSLASMIFLFVDWMNSWMSLNAIFLLFKEEPLRLPKRLHGIEPGWRPSIRRTWTERPTTYKRSRPKKSRAHLYHCHRENQSANKSKYSVTIFQLSHDQSPPPRTSHISEWRQTTNWLRAIAIPQSVRPSAVCPRHFGKKSLS